MEAVPEMEVEKVGKGEEGVDGTQWEMGSLEFITQDTDPSGKTLVHARNGFNELSCLEMLWNVQHNWPAGARFVINFYRH